MLWTDIAAGDRPMSNCRWSSIVETPRACLQALAVAQRHVQVHLVAHPQYMGKCVAECTVAPKDRVRLEEIPTHFEMEHLHENRSSGERSCASRFARFGSC